MMHYSPSDYIILSLRKLTFYCGRGPENPNTLNIPLLIVVLTHQRSLNIAITSVWVVGTQDPGPHIRLLVPNPITF